MSGEIDTTGNVVHMAVAVGGRAPWWETEGFEAYRVHPDESPAEWREKALDWEVRAAPVEYLAICKEDRWRGSGTARSHHMVSPDRRVIYRDDTMEALCTGASDQYHVHRIGLICDAMEMVCQKGDYQMSTIGSLRGGKEIWFMAETTADNFLAGEQVKRNLILSTSYDLTRKSLKFISNTYVVCNNTLTLAIDTADDIMRISHREPYDPRKVVGNLELITAAEIQYANEVDALANTEMNSEELSRFYIRAAMNGKPLGDLELMDNDAKAIIERIADKISASYFNAPGGANHANRVESRVGTLHGATQAVFHYVDYTMLGLQTPRKVTKERPFGNAAIGSTVTSKSNRLQRAFFGDGARLKNTAHRMAVNMSLAA